MKNFNLCIYTIYLLFLGNLPIVAGISTEPLPTNTPLYERSDSILAQYLNECGIPITTGNSVKLLKSGHDKFVDMFKAIKEAKSFVHLEYFKNLYLFYAIQSLLIKK